jgi:multidrug efflux pump subunit AcrA (membrane-fusion protein)
VTVEVNPADPTATGNWDQAPVRVAITTATVNNALVVPVNSLLALAGGGYAVEVVGRNATNHLVTVSLGIFDDAAGLVQVSGPGLTSGERVVVPSGR